MHAVLVHVTLSDPQGSEVALREQVVPRISGARLRRRLLDSEGQWRCVDDGLADRDAANTASEMVRSAPERMTVESVEVREVVASA